MPSRRPAVRLQRPALVRRLAAMLTDGAVMLVAPAGGGKATALQAALGRRGGAVACVHCTAADADAARLLARVIGALRQAVPGVADALGETIAAATEPVFGHEAVEALVEELERLLLDPLTIVVDDAEHLEGSASALALVSALIGARAPQLRVAVLTREPLPLPAARLEGHDLAFSVDECRALLGVSADGDAICAATGGWPLGVSLAVRSGDVVDADASDDRLVEVLLDPLDVAVREAVIDASMAPELDERLLAAIDLPGDFVDLVRAGGIPLRTSGGIPAFHPLVREFLRRRLELERPSEYRELLRTRVAKALEAAGRGPDAVEYWLDSADEAGAAVARYGDAVVDTAPATVARWLSRVPGPARLAPELRLIEGRLALGTGRPLDAPAALRDAVLGFGARGDEERAWAARVALIDALVALDRFDAAIPFANGFETAAAAAAPMAGIGGAAALAGAGRYDEAVEQLSLALRHRRGAPFAPFAAAFRGFWVDVPRGELDAALAGVRDAVSALERADPFKRLAYVLVMLAVVHEERGEDDAALATLGAARRAAERTALGGFAAAASRRLAAGVLARAGRLDEAAAAVAGDAPGAKGAFAGDVAVTRATIAAARGENELAVAEARRAIDEGALGWWGARRRLVAQLAPVLSTAGEPAWARELVEDALAARPPDGSAMGLLALRAWLAASPATAAPAGDRDVARGHGDEATRRVAADEADGDEAGGDAADAPAALADAAAFAAAAEAALAEGGRDALAAAAARWTGEPALIGLYARVLDALADACLAEGDAAAAVDPALRRSELDPRHEGAQRRLMLAYARTGRPGHALRQYLVLRRALGATPGEETSALQRRIRAGEPA